MPPEDASDFYGLAVAHILINAMDKALTSLREAIQREPSYRTEAQNDDAFDQIRNHPDFQALMNGQDHPT